MLVQESFHRHHEPRRAISALLCVVIDEGRRNRMQLAVLRDAFDGLDVFPLRVDGQDGATVDHLAVHDDGAGAAGCPVADFLCAGQLQVIAQRVDQGDARLDVQVVGLAVDLERDWHGSRSGDVASRRRQRPFSRSPGPQRACADTHAANKAAARESAIRAFWGASGSFLELTRHLPFASFEVGSKYEDFGSERS